MRKTHLSGIRVQYIRGGVGGCRYRINFRNFNDTFKTPNVITKFQKFRQTQRVITDSGDK